MPGYAVARELAFDDHLSGDAGVVGARLPERIVSAHPGIADQNVLQRVVERMAHVQAAGDVRRRDNDGERRGLRTTISDERASASQRAYHFSSISRNE